jgi:hypothetical protein
VFYYYVISTDNFGGDYPDERFLKKGSIIPNTIEWTKEEGEAQPYTNKNAADRVAFSLNRLTGDPYAPRFYRSVEEGYILQPGFEP